MSWDNGIYTGRVEENMAGQCQISRYRHRRTVGSTSRISYNGIIYLSGFRVSFGLQIWPYQAPSVPHECTHTPRFLYHNRSILDSISCIVFSAHSSPPIATVHSRSISTRYVWESSERVTVGLDMLPAGPSWRSDRPTTAAATLRVHLAICMVWMCRVRHSSMGR